MKVNTPISDSPITPNGDKLEYRLDANNHVQRGFKRTPDGDPNSKKFFSNLTKLFGFRRKNNKNGKSDIEFVKVDPQSDLRVAQSKIGKVLKSKMGDRLEEYFNAWLNETTDTVGSLQDRFKRISELEFAINNDPFLGMVVDLMADEATQLDQQDKLIMVDCADSRMKLRMEELLTQWAVTQNRVRGAMWNLAAYGDAFWSNKITKNGVVRINPLDVRQVLDRLEFNPMKVSSDITLKQGFLTALSRDERLQMLMDTIEDEANNEFADLFDSKLFGFVISNDFVVPPWNITHFRLQADQSEFAPFGKPMLLKALAPFRQANATMTLQSLARIMNFPVTVYEVATTPGMDAAQQFDRVNDAREQYDNIGVTGSNSETYSVNTKMWMPKGLVEMKVLSPNIDLNAIGDLEMYQDRVVVASGVPKGYLVPEWGSFGVSGISLMEQHKPFARKVFTLQSAFLEGITNLFRLHFAITGEFDYFEPFVLSMKFPNSENSSERVNAKTSSLNLSKSVIDTVADLIGSLNDPLPPEIVQDILTKFSFLDPEDIKKWIRVRATKTQGEGMPDDSGGGDLGGGGGGMPPAPSGGDSGGEPDLGGAEGGSSEADTTDEEGSPDASEIDDSQFQDVDLEGMEGEAEGEETAEEGDFETEEMPEEEPEIIPPPTNKESYATFTKRRLSEKRYNELSSRYTGASSIIYESIIKRMAQFDEISTNNRHYKYAVMEPSMEQTLKVLDNFNKGKSNKRSLKEIQEGLRGLRTMVEEEKDSDTSPITLSNIIKDFRKENDESFYSPDSNDNEVNPEIVDDADMDYNEVDSDSEELMLHRKKHTNLRM